MTKKISVVCFLVKLCKAMRHYLVLGGDAAAHDNLCDSIDINNTGESLFDCLISTVRLVYNKDNRPTFSNRIRKRIIYVILLQSSSGCYQGNVTCRTI